MSSQFFKQWSDLSFKSNETTLAAADLNEKLYHMLAEPKQALNALIQFEKI